MHTAQLDGFDPTPYQRIPLVDLASLLALARALLDLQPPVTGADAAALESRAARLAELAIDVEAELGRGRARIGRYGPPVEFDGGTDALWVVLHERLASYDAYLHPGFDMLVDNPYTPLGAVLEQSRERARRARALAERLFGASGLSFLAAPFCDQCEATGAILDRITREDLGEPLSELVGAELLAQLYLLQEQYELMVEDQRGAARVSGDQLRALRLGLVRALGRYVDGVLALADEARPASIAQVTAALRPLLRLRELLGAPRVVGAALDDLAELAPAREWVRVRDPGVSPDRARGTA